jgi:hypothetical protein
LLRHEPHDLERPSLGGGVRGAGIPCGSGGRPPPLALRRSPAGGSPRPSCSKEEEAEEGPSGPVLPLRCPRRPALLSTGPGSPPTTPPRPPLPRESPTPTPTPSVPGLVVVASTPRPPLDAFLSSMGRLCAAAPPPFACLGIFRAWTKGRSRSIGIEGVSLGCDRRAAPRWVWTATRAGRDFSQNFLTVER